MNRPGALAGKVAIITGAARGMGAAQAEMFVEEGAFVVATDVRDDEGREFVASLGECAAYFPLDVGDKEQWSDLVHTVEREFGSIDVLVNNAGISRAGALEDVATADFEAMVSVNQRGVLLGMQAVVGAMRRADGGSIVNIASAAGMRGDPGLIAYTGTKFAVRGMTQVAASELAEHNIRVNVVNPGVIVTPMHHEEVPADKAEWLVGRVPLKRFGAPREVAAAVLFLASDASSYITGIDLLVDGGILLTAR